MPRVLSAAGLVLSLSFLLVGCGGEKGATAGATVTVTVQATDDETDTSPVDTLEAPTTVTTTESSAATPEDAEIAVRKAGVAQSDGGEVGYGMVLQNLSATDDAIDVTVTVNLLDGSGAILATEAESVNVIPASTTYYLGGSSSVSEGKVAKLEPIVAVGSSETAQYTLPKVSRVKLIEQEYFGLTVRGEVENTLDQPLSQFAKIGVVVFDAAGKVIGGGFAYLDADLPPGRRAGFSSSNGTNAVPVRAAAKAFVTVENEVTTP
jgi:hypothetical protein